MAPAESYVRIGEEKIFDRGELVFPHVVMVYHPQVITMGKSYTMPFYSGIKDGGLVIINDDIELLTEEERSDLAKKNVTVYYVPATKIALEIAGTELATNMGMLGALAGLTHAVTMDGLDKALQDRFGKKYVASGGTATLDEAFNEALANRTSLSLQVTVVPDNSKLSKKTYTVSLPLSSLGKSQVNPVMQMLKGFF